LRDSAARLFQNPRISAVTAGVSMFFIEDESNDPLAHIPQSVSYLKGLKA